jgi:hypothetical protein
METTSGGHSVALNLPSIIFVLKKLLSTIEAVEREVSENIASVYLFIYFSERSAQWTEETIRGIFFEFLGTI